MVSAQSKGIARPSPRNECVVGTSPQRASCSTEPARRFGPRRRVSPAPSCLLLATVERAAGTRASGFRPALGLYVRPPWWKDGEGNWRPGRGGLTLAVNHLPALADGLADALERAREFGLIEPATKSKDRTAAERQRRYRRRHNGGVTA
jgi:hypothetical protein